MQSHSPTFCTWASEIVRSSPLELSYLPPTLPEDGLRYALRGGAPMSEEEREVIRQMSEDAFGCDSMGGPFFRVVDYHLSEGPDPLSHPTEVAGLIVWGDPDFGEGSACMVRNADSETPSWVGSIKPGEYDILYPGEWCYQAHGWWTAVKGLLQDTLPGVMARIAEVEGEVEEQEGVAGTELDAIILEELRLYHPIQAIRRWDDSGAEIVVPMAEGMMMDPQCYPFPKEFEAHRPPPALGCCQGVFTDGPRRCPARCMVMYLMRRAVERCLRDT